MDCIDTIIVGGGQAGLAMSYFLTQLGREHVVLEQAAQAAPVWRNQRWDSFTLVTPNWALKMPGAEYHGPELDAYLPRDELTAYFERPAGIPPLWRMSTASSWRMLGSCRTDRQLIVCNCTC